MFRCAYMVNVFRYKGNPIIKPNKDNPWEAQATFNGCAIKDNNRFHIVYRAMGHVDSYHGMGMDLSTIGYAKSKDGFNFTDRRQLIKPEQGWETYGCEDLRITKMDGKFFIFYTSLSTWPPTAGGIKLAVAVTKDFQNIERHPVTFFNSKAMAMFPKRIGGELAAILTVHTDIPPSKICIATFDNEEQIWSRPFWEEWYSRLGEHIIPLSRSDVDQIEIGAPPVKTKYGWLLIYSYIKNYRAPPPTFGIETVLLDLTDPRKIIGRLETPLLTPKTEYEIYGNVPNIVFPSGALVYDGKLFVYYGGADTTCCVATADLEELLEKIVRSV